MSSVDNEQLNNIVQDAVNATANAHQKYINALEQRLKYKDAEIDRLKEILANEREGIIQLNDRIDMYIAEAIKEYMDKVIFEIVNKPTKFEAEEGTADFLSGMAHRQNQILDIIKELAGGV